MKKLMVISLIATTLALTACGKDPVLVEKERKMELQRERDAMEVIRGEEVHKEHRKKELLRTIEHLKIKHQKAEYAQKKVQELEVLSAEYKVREVRGKSVPVIDLSVQNNTELIISKAVFEGVVTAKGQSKPLIKEQFTYVFYDHLKKGEQIKIAMNELLFYSPKWSLSQIPNNNNIEISVAAVKIWDNYGNQKFIDEFTDDEQIKYRHAKENYQEDFGELN